MAKIMYACKMYPLDRVMPIRCIINWNYKIKFILTCTLYSLAATYYILYTSVLYSPGAAHDQYTTYSRFIYHIIHIFFYLLNTTCYILHTSYSILREHSVDADDLSLCPWYGSDIWVTRMGNCFTRRRRRWWKVVPSPTCNFSGKVAGSTMNRCA